MPLAARPIAPKMGWFLYFSAMGMMMSSRSSTYNSTAVSSLPKWFAAMITFPRRNFLHAVNFDAGDQLHDEADDGT
ncbi:MAG: hypothetical protein MZV49_25470 [Rhodopseudomonas palustris]|nr:hypothetical protein [Rhodopseudomonas palustris]